VQTAEVARQRLERANAADEGHPYLSLKRITPERLWQNGDWLLVPMTDIEGNLWNIQTIRPNGEKRFLAGGRTKGVFWWRGRPEVKLVIGEGVATVAAVSRATGLPVVAAMSAGNLPDVAAMIHSKQPDLELIIAADDDKAGIEAARLASQRTGALIALPEDISNG
jgi:putative DNA primase/helicase